MRSTEPTWSNTLTRAAIRLLRLAGISALLASLAGAVMSVQAAALSQSAPAAQTDSSTGTVQETPAVPAPSSAAGVQDSSVHPVTVAAKAAGKPGKKDAKKKKEKAPKLTPIHIEQGTLTIDGWTGKARLNYDIADLKYIYVWAPGIGTIVASNQKFPLGKEEKEAFNGNNLTLQADGHTIQISSEKKLLKDKKPVSAWVYVDTVYRTNAAFPQMGYGATTAAPYVWPGAKDAPVEKGGVVAPPPLPAGMRPKLAKPACPAPAAGTAPGNAPAACPPASNPTSNSPSTPSTPPPVPLPGYGSGTTTAKVDPSVQQPPR